MIITKNKIIAMETYTFYDGYTDILNMNNSEYFQQFSLVLNNDFEPNYLAVSFPAHLENEVLLRSEEFILDEKCITNIPTKVIRVSCLSDDDIGFRYLLDGYSAVSYVLDENGTILMDVPIYQQ